MIRINLLPAEFEAIAPIQMNPAIPIAGAAIFPLLILVPFHFSQMHTRSIIQTEINSTQSQLNQYKPILDQIDQLEQAKKTLNDRKSVIQQLELERLRYPQFMDDFLKLLPSNIWLTNLNTVIQPSGNSLTVGMDVIALDNYAIADLISNLETSQTFTEVDLGAISTGQSGASQTMAFHVSTVYKKVAEVADAIKKP